MGTAHRHVRVDASYGHRMRPHCTHLPTKPRASDRSLPGNDRSAALAANRSVSARPAAAASAFLCVSVNELRRTAASLPLRTQSTPPPASPRQLQWAAYDRCPAAAAPPADPAPRDPRQRLQREQLRLGKRLQRQVGQAIADFGMISPGDKIMVCLSGGKDSYTMLDMLLQLQRKAPVPFTLVAVNLDQKQPDFPAHVLPAYLDALGVPFDIVEQDTYSVVSRVVPAGKTMCSLCSRLRRGALYAYAQTHGVTKIALGHHRDDIVATFFMNLFHHARLAAMAPKLRSDDGAHVVIRPLAYVREAHIAAYAQARQFPIIPCNLCGSQENLQRQQVGKMLQHWDHEQPGRVEQIARALGDVRPEQLADRTLFDFLALGRSGDAPPDLAPDPGAWLTASDATHDSD